MCERTLIYLYLFKFTSFILFYNIIPFNLNTSNIENGLVKSRPKNKHIFNLISSHRMEIKVTHSHYLLLKLLVHCIYFDFLFIKKETKEEFTFFLKHYDNLRLEIAI